jgi:hypothetical protein
MRMPEALGAGTEALPLKQAGKAARNGIIAHNWLKGWQGLKTLFGEHTAILGCEHLKSDG